MIFSVQSDTLSSGPRTLSGPGESCMRQYTRSSLIQIMAWLAFGIKPLSQQTMVYCNEIWIKIQIPYKQTILNTSSVKGRLHYDTVYPKKYAYGFCFAVLCCGYTLTDFPIAIRLTSLALWQSNDCPSASKATWWIWINTSCEFIMNDCITTTKQSTTKPCAYFLGYTVNQHFR